MYISNEFSRLEINLNGCLENYRYFRSRLEASTKLLIPMVLFLVVVMVMVMLPAFLSVKM